MKNLLKLEELGMFLLCSMVYFQYYQGSWGFYLGLFFVPDVSFVFVLFSKKIATILYNVFHHKGAISIFIFVGYFLSNELLIKIGLIFMAHSCFDRIAGYGLKYFDSFDHTHLGWKGKSKYKNDTNYSS